MQTSTIIIILVIVILFIVGLYLFVSRIVNYNNMLDKAKDIAKKFCKSSNVNDASKCYVDSMIDQFNCNRTKDLILNNASPTLVETGFIAAIILKCANKCLL